MVSSSLHQNTTALFLQPWKCFRCWFSSLRCEQLGRQTSLSRQRFSRSDRWIWCEPSFASIISLFGYAYSATTRSLHWRYHKLDRWKQWNQSRYSKLLRNDHCKIYWILSTIQLMKIPYKRPRNSALSFLVFTVKNNRLRFLLAAWHRLSDKMEFCQFPSVLFQQTSSVSSNPRFKQSLAFS